MKEVTTLPPMMHSFSITVKGKETGETYEGKFTYQRLNLGKKMESAKMQAKLSEDLLTIPSDVKMFIEMVSFLRYALIESPDWWKNSGYGLNLYDVEVITTLFQECDKFDKEWEKKVYGDKDKIEMKVE